MRRCLYKLLNFKDLKLLQILFHLPQNSTLQALGLTQQQMSKLNSSQHRRVVSSPEHYHQREPSDPIGMH